MSTFTNLTGETLLDGDRVLVERYLLEPGQDTGMHLRADPQLVVYIHGGTLTAANGRATLWLDGRVRWVDGETSPDSGSINTGETTIEFVVITVKPVLSTSSAPVRAAEPLSYPNIAGEDLLDNDWVIVQRFCFLPGQWEGVHAHQPNMLYVHIRGGHWGSRSYADPFMAYPERSPDGSVSWMEPVDIDVGHESCNIGDSPIDLVWVSLKR